MKPTAVQVPEWTQDDYGELVADYQPATMVLMFIAWNSTARTNAEGSVYSEYDFVGVTKADIPLDALIDGKYKVGYKENSGRFNRVFMNYAEGVDRDVRQQQADLG